jgi:hypothetical protein
LTGDLVRSARINGRLESVMPVDGEQETIIERRVASRRPSSAGPLASVLIVLGVIAAVALGWWVVGTAPLPDNRASQAPAASADNSTPRAALPEATNSGKPL